MKTMIEGTPVNMTKEEVYNLTGIDLMSKKEALEWAKEMVENKENRYDDEIIHIWYKDGSYYELSDIEEGKFKTTVGNVESIIITNGGAMIAAGKVDFKDLDNGGGCWNVYPR